MDDDVIVRAVTIGASVFITLATVSAVMMYYSTAKAGVSSLATGTNIETRYREDIKSILYSGQVTGAELKNILQYFYGNRDINIYVDKYYQFSNDSALKKEIFTDKLNTTSVTAYTEIMKTMMPNQKFSITIDENKYSFKLIT